MKKLTQNITTATTLAALLSLITSPALAGDLTVERLEPTLLFADETAQPTTTYYYRVCAVDTAGQKGPFSAESSVRTKSP